MGWFSRFEDHCEAQMNAEDYSKHRDERGEDDQTEHGDHLRSQAEATRRWWR